ncbi:phosphoglycerate mutase, partial [Candidatus Micrarchaeota archaeon]|nr:phosphoglycerate mutase [Candidatus Micrarchaeota archaeon]
TGMLRIAGDVAPESDVGVFSVLGYNPFKYHVGRGALEAFGINAGFRNGMLGLRANFATTDSDGTKIFDRRVGRHLGSTDAKALEKELNKKVRLTNASFVFRATLGHRGVLLINSREKLSARISNTDPAYEIKQGLGSAKSVFEMRVQKSKPSEHRAAAVRAAALVNEVTEKAHAVLEKSAVNARRKKRGLLPANELLLRDAETEIRRPPKLYGKEKWAILADMPLEIGIGKLIGMKVIRASPPTFTASDYEGRAKKTLALLKKFDGVYVHIKGPDLFGHDGDAAGKRKSVDDIDRFFFKPLLKKLDLSSTRVAVTADHSTPCELKAHSNNPVPFLIAGAGVFEKGVSKFGETECMKNGVKPGPWLMRQLLS